MHTAIKCSRAISSVNAELIFHKECRLLGYDAVWLFMNRRFDQRAKNNLTSNQQSEHVVFLYSELQLLVTGNVVLNSLIIFSLITYVMHPSKRRFLQEPNNQQGGILRSYRSENLKSYISFLSGWNVVIE
jgi:hypothetical protein